MENSRENSTSFDLSHSKGGTATVVSSHFKQFIIEKDMVSLSTPNVPLG